VLIALIVIASTSRRAATATGLVVAGTVAGVFAVSNASKEVSGDWRWYTYHFALQEHMPLSQYLGTRIDRVTPEVTEPAYYAVSRVVSVLTGGDVAILAIVVTILIYGTLGVACVVVARQYSGDAFVVGVATFLGLIFGLTFTLTTQLVRQEIAAAVIALGLVLLASHRRTLSVMCFALAVLTHNSAIIPIAALLVAYALSRFRGNYLVKSVIVVGLFWVLGQVYIRGIGAAQYEGASAGEISPLILTADVVLAGAFIILIRGKLSTPISHWIILALPGVAGFLAGVASQPTPFLRVYFYVEVLRALMIAILAGAYLRRGYSAPIILFGVLVAGYAYLALRLESSPFVYGTTPWEVLFLSPEWFSNG
jgi:hypothetical protein